MDKVIRTPRFARRLMQTLRLRAGDVEPLVLAMQIIMKVMFTGTGYVVALRCLLGIAPEVPPEEPKSGAKGAQPGSK